jgi:ABC-2 type transport system ATP-binding protein/bacitracin transport system ATP-binding protein
VVEINTLNNEQALKELLQSNWSGQILVDRCNSKQVIMQLDEKLLPSLHKHLVELGIGVLSVKPMHSLEDYFLQITSTQKYV